jgi:HK97 family phage major capsid protein
MTSIPEEFTKAIELQFKNLSKDVQDALQQAGVARAIAVELEQKSVRGGTDGAAGETWGQQVVRAEELKSIASESARRPMTAKFEVKEITSAGGSAGAMMTAPTRDTYVGLPQRRLTIRGLLNVVPVTTGEVTYPRQTGFTNNAAPVAETLLKPESDMTFEDVTVPIRTIAHWVRHSRQILDDAPQLAAVIDGDLRYGLALVEEAQILFGSGSGQNLNGLVAQATAYAAPGGLVASNLIDQIGIALLQASLTNVPPDGIVLNPVDWLAMRLLKDGQGNYILGSPATDVTPSLFGTPIAVTPAMTVDKFLLGSFRSQTLYDRLTAEVLISTEDRDNFVTNRCTVRAEERVGLAAKRPTALIFGDLGRQP